MRINLSYNGKTMSANFPVFTHAIGFVGFFGIMEN